MVIVRMIKFLLAGLGALLVTLAYAAPHRVPVKPPFQTGVQQLTFSVKQDYKHYYSKPVLTRLLATLSIGAAFANTNIDQSIANWYQSRVRSTQTNDISRYVKPFGSKTFMLSYIAALGAAALLPRGVTGSALGQWGFRSVRAIIVGWPPMYFFQYAFGSYRPNANKNSHWHPFNESHGVSGHSFMGAIPFLTAAQMTHNPYLKAFFYVGSTVTGLSRINDREHYFSQVFMGWSMAYLAVSSVSHTGNAWPITLIPLPGGAGVSASVSL